MSIFILTDLILFRPVQFLPTDAHKHTVMFFLASTLIVRFLYFLFFCITYFQTPSTKTNKNINNCKHFFSNICFRPCSHWKMRQHFSNVNADRIWMW